MNSDDKEATQLEEENLRALARDDSEAVKNLGNKAFEKGDLVRAKQLYLLAAEAGNATALNNLGVLAKNSHSLKEARDYLLQALAKYKANNAPDDLIGMTQYNLGLIAYEDDLKDEALDWWLKAAEKEHQDAIYNLGILYKELGDFHSARHWLSQATKPGNNNIYKASRNLADLAKNPACPVDVLELLSDDPDFQVRLKLAQREDCPVSVIEKLANDKSKRVKEAIAKRKDLPEKTRRDLHQQGFANAEEILLNKSGDELTYEDVIKVKVVQERANLVKMITDSDTLLALAKDASTTVRFEVAENINTPDEALKTILELCRGDYSTGVNATIINRIITHPNCSEETLKIAANISNGFNLTLFFERSPAISFELFLHVLNFIDIGAGFAKIAKKNFKIRSQEFNDEHWRAVATHTKSAVRALVAASPTTPPEFYEILAIDESQRVREAIVGNKKAPQTARAAAALLS